MYRGGKVWAQVDDQGELVTERGLVKIRYREDDDREYSAKASDVEDIDEARLKKKPKSSSRKPSSKKSPPKTMADELPPDTLVIYTDGACYGNPGPAGIGALLEWRGQEKEISEFLGHGTNNIAELTAIQRALESVKNPRVPVRLFTDSSYAIGVLTQGWKVKENRELVAKIRGLLGKFPNLQLIKVKGHSGDPRNERVDQLARDGIDRQDQGSN